MYFTPIQISKSVSCLRNVHPFHGITFLACKKSGLPIGSTTDFAMDAVTNDFLIKHHKIDPKSGWFYQPYASIKSWLKYDYASSGLQAINTQTFAGAFIHDPGTRIWGWANNYIEVLQAKLKKKKLIPLFDIAVWVYKEKKWPRHTTLQNITDTFIREFQITKDELSLFDHDFPDGISISNIFRKSIYSWNELKNYFEPPPDAAPDRGGILASLKLEGIGPGKELVLEPGKRLSLITGDNGLGKTFLLECAWWALTGKWAEKPAYPRLDNKDKASISFSIENRQGHVEATEIKFNWDSLSWPIPQKRPTIPGLIVYARVDGSFAVWDPIRNAKNRIKFPPMESDQFIFTRNDVWDGLSGYIEGLVRDWVKWQSMPTKYPYETFTRLLESLSPPDIGKLIPGEPVRIPDDPREIPTIIHPYGKTPIVYASAGVKRIITLAYLIVWAWNEHTIAAGLANNQPERRLVVLVDEMEAHLHPKWQREVLPALMSIGEMLSNDLDIQFIVATHSPLILASSEVLFDNDIDSLIHLDIDENANVTLESIDYARFGDASSWLTSPVFDMKHARSKEAEAALEDAKALQLSNDISEERVKEVTVRLSRFLSNDDKFWPRWIAFAEKYGINL